MYRASRQIAIECMPGRACGCLVLGECVNCPAQVRADCEPLELLDFLAGDSAAAASEAAQQAASDNAAEEELLNLVGLQSILSALPSFYLCMTQGGHV